MELLYGRYGLMNGCAALLGGRCCYETMIHRRLAKLNELEERRKKKEERNISELWKGLYARTTQLFTAVS